MYNSISQFQSKGVEKLEKIFMNYSDDLKKTAEMIYGVTDAVVELGLSIIREEWEGYDELLYKRKDLRPGWQVIRRDIGTKITSLGEVKYQKTYFHNPKTGERSYLVDHLLGFEPGQKMTEDAVARILEEAVSSSYRKGGENVSIAPGTVVSKETVMDKIHPLEFPPVKAEKEKKQVSVLYIDADEDHVSLQYLDQKGDIKDSRSNTYMPKLAYVYEEINADNDRHELVGVKYFGGGYEGSEGTKKLWKEVYDYIAEAYDENTLEKIYVNGDGADWIKQGAKVHAKATFVLDKYHMHKYIIAATSHLLDSKQDARNEIWHAINAKKKWLAEETFDKILSITETESKCKAVEHSKNYVLGHWSAIMNGVKNRKDNIHCSAEGHVSHVYSDRLSSRPLGWCKIGADKMARLRAYEKNKGNMLELVRYQKLPKVSGAEEIVYTSTDMLKMERANQRKLGKNADMPVYSIPYPQIKKIAAIKNHIWGL